MARAAYQNPLKVVPFLRILEFQELNRTANVLRNDGSQTDRIENISTLKVQNHVQKKYRYDLIP